MQPSGLTYTGSTNVTGGKLLAQTNITASSAVNVSGGGVLQLGATAGNNRMIKTASVAATAGGQVDLQNNKMILTGQSLGTLTGSTTTALRA